MTGRWKEGERKVKRKWGKAKTRMEVRSVYFERYESLAFENGVPNAETMSHASSLRFASNLMFSYQ